MEKQKPEFMIVYKCEACGLESGYTELDKPKCRFCEGNGTMTIVSKQELTAEVMAARLKAVTDSMMKNMEMAFDSMTEEGKISMGDQDAEGEMLKLMARIQKFKDQVQQLKLRNPDDEK